MTQTMLEKVAAGMRQAYAEHTNDNIVPWTSAGSPQKAAWLVCARAALQALREPTKAMIAAGTIQAWNMETPDPTYHDENAAVAVHHAMIDAILQEKPEPL